MTTEMVVLKKEGEERERDTRSIPLRFAGKTGNDQTVDEACLRIREEKKNLEKIRYSTKKKRQLTLFLLFSC